MTEDAPLDHQEEALRAPIPFLRRPEISELPRSSDAEFVDRQLDMWLKGAPPLYHTALVQHILVETDPDPTLRAGNDEDAVAHEARLAAIAHNELLDNIQLPNAIGGDIIETAKSLLSDDDLRLQAVLILERMHKTFYRYQGTDQLSEVAVLYHAERMWKLIDRVMLQHSISSSD